jgi:peptide deformylase
MFEVVTYGNPVLRQVAEPVTVFDEQLKRFVDEMVETMYEEDGVGLAAPQVGRSIRLAVIDATAGESPPIVLINPRITWSSEEVGDYEEGCLSIPDISINVSRPVSVSVEAQDVQGTPFVIEKATGLLARALQHEFDHLEGILFVDRISALHKQLVGGKLKKMAKFTRSRA